MLVRKLEMQDSKGNSSDRIARSVALAPGDGVLVKNSNFKERGGPGKLRSYSEDAVHIVVGRMNCRSPA